MDWLAIGPFHGGCNGLEGQPSWTESMVYTVAGRPRGLCLRRHVLLRFDARTIETRLPLATPHCSYVSEEHTLRCLAAQVRGGLGDACSVPRWVVCVRARPWGRHYPEEEVL